MNFMIGHLTKNTDLLKIAPKKYIGDLSNFNMAFTLLWAYVNYSQWLIIYSGNLAEEAPWFLERMRNGWQYVAGSLIFIQFLLPFLTLAIGTNLKREPRRMMWVAGLILFMRAVDLFWLTQPTHRSHFSIHWLDVASIVGIGGVWLWFWASEFRKTKEYVSLNDPRLHGEWPPHGNHRELEQHGGDAHGIEAHAGTEVKAHG
jgi:hypothetical protein